MRTVAFIIIALANFSANAKRNEFSERSHCLIVRAETAITIPGLESNPQFGAGVDERYGYQVPGGTSGMKCTLLNELEGTFTLNSGEELKGDLHFGTYEIPVFYNSGIQISCTESGPDKVLNWNEKAIGYINSAMAGQFQVELCDEK